MEVVTMTSWMHR